MTLHIPLDRKEDVYIYISLHTDFKGMKLNSCILHESRVQGKCITIPTRTTKEKGAALGGTRTHDTLLSRQSALPTELPGQLSKQGSKSTIQHKDKVKPQYSVLWHR